MQNLKKIVLLSVVFGTVVARAQNAEVILNYINTYKDLAIEEMQRSGVPASIKLAQGIHETLAGTSDLVLASNNHFGIKCKDTWTGESVNHDDDAKGECFRKYPSAADSYRDHSNFLKGSDRYSFLFKLDPTDYKDWAYGLKRAGYATNPRYPQIIIGLIETYHLQDYTLIALGKLSHPAEPTFAKADVEVKKNSESISGQAMPIATASVKTDEQQKAKEPEAVTGQPNYPVDEFRINETRVVYVKKGTPYLAIAGQYDVSLARLFEFNDMKPAEIADKDQLIYLQRKRKTGNNEFHIMQPGETLHDIAQQEAIRLETLLEYNQLNADMKPANGEQLYLRTKAPSAPKLALKETYSTIFPGTASVNNTYAVNTKSYNEGNAITYTVQSKETIYSISKRYNVNIDDIVKWNQLSSYDLKMGQQLKIYK